MMIRKVENSTWMSFHGLHFQTDTHLFHEKHPAGEGCQLFGGPWSCDDMRSKFSNIKACNCGFNAFSLHETSGNIKNSIPNYQEVCVKFLPEFQNFRDGDGFDLFVVTFFVRLKLHF